MDDMRAQADEPSDVIAREMTKVAKVDGTVYLSAFPSYCVLVTAPADQVDPLTGRKTVGRPTKALFQEGRYVNNARDPKTREFIDGVLQANSRFGKPGSGADYWLADEAIRMTQAAAKASALATLRAMPKEAVEQFLSELQQGDSTDQAMPAPPAGPAA
jgi:hypothetical protein